MYSFIKLYLMLVTFFKNLVNLIDSLRLKFIYIMKIYTPQKLTRVSDVFKKTSVSNFREVNPKLKFNHTPKLFLGEVPNISLRPINSYTLISFIYNSVSNIWWRSFSFGFYYLQGFIFLLFIDACLTDDEPLCEPIEWSLVQTWILFIFLFGWIAENLIVSRYGSYTGRDKRVWMSWYKTFWLIEIYYIINFAAAACFVITPFYFEINYSLPFVYTWWDWYTRVFFFKFISLFSLVLIITNFIQLGGRWLNWYKVLYLVTFINLILGYLLYTTFIISFFGYLTNPLWYQKNRAIDYIQLSHEPAKWGWGIAKRDHFTYHCTRTVFWFKNDGPMAASLMLFHMYFLLSLFFVFIYWVALFRRIYSMKEVPVTYTTYCVSSLRQLFYCFLFLYFFVLLSFVTGYWRLPIELLWGLDYSPWILNFLSIICDYPMFFIELLS